MRHTTLQGLVSTQYIKFLNHHLWGHSARLLSFFCKTGLSAMWSAFVNSHMCPAHWRFLYFHGQRHARLAQDQTVYDKPKRGRSALITLLSPLFFLEPEVHLRDMERLWTDEVIIEKVWKTFMAKRLGEWEGVIICVRFHVLTRLCFILT